MTMSHRESCGGHCESMGHWYKPLGPCTTKVRAVSVFSAQSKARSQWVLDSRLSLVTILFVNFMDRISRRSRGEESVLFGELRIASLLFADDVVLLATSDRDLQHALERFAVSCKLVGMRVSTSKSEAMVLCQKTPSGLGVSCCPKRRNSSISGSCARVRVKWSGRMTDWCGACSNAGDVPVCYVEEGLPIYWSIYVPTLTYDLLQSRSLGSDQKNEIAEVAELSFRQPEGARSRFAAPLSQLRWFGHLIRMPPMRLPLEVFRIRPTGRRPQGRP